MIFINGEELKFTLFPNGETNVDHKQLVEVVDSLHLNKVKFIYQNDLDLIRLMFVKRYMDRIKVKSELLITYMPYSRMDRIEGGSVFTLKYVADFINSLNFDRVEIVEPHSDVTPALINNAIEVYPTVNILYDVKTRVGFNINTDYIYFPDAGAEKRYSKKIGGFNQLVGFKKRDFETGRITSLQVLGEMKGTPKIIMIDDLCSYGGTFMLGATELRKMGASEIYLVVGHCEDSIYKGDIFKTDLIKKVYTTNSILTNLEQATYEGKLVVYNT
jgi:ribose-phosphate pyrophosphokinase